MVTLREMLAAARAGQGSVALLVGDPGIGKTRTAEELAARARETGAIVRWGHCFEGEGAPAFWPWVQVLRSHVHERAAQTLARELGRDAAVIAQIIPEVRERLPRLPAPPSSSDNVAVTPLPHFAE